MELTKKTVELRKLTAGAGFWLTKKGESVENQTFAKSVFLGGAEKPEDWEEITDEQKESIEAQQDEIIKKKTEGAQKMTQKSYGS